MRSQYNTANLASLDTRQEPNHLVDEALSAMITDAEKSEPLLRADVCIVGAGPAGIVLADELERAGMTSIVIETGRWSYSNRHQKLSDATVTTNTSLHDSWASLHSRRQIGGCSNVWKGYCMELDEIDFEDRGLTDTPGWPISHQQLRPYYQRALSIFDIESFIPARAIPGTALHLSYFAHAGKIHFGQRYKESIGASQAATLLYDATVTDITYGENSNRVESVSARTLQGKSIKIRARRFVLAAGGIGNPRLMLSSASRPDDVSAYKSVGHYFMEHPHILYKAGLVWLPEDDSPLVRDIGSHTPVICINENLLRSERLPNFSVSLHEVADVHFSDELRRQLEHFNHLYDKNGTLYTTFIRSEALPRYDNRVGLQTAADALGTRRASVTWNVDADNANAIRRCVEILARELSKVSAGRMQVAFSPATDIKAIAGGGHLMGTTRMSETAADGVVDRDCRVHGTENLFLAGSSVFSTSGFANPTFTIVALVLRLADHLKRTT